MTTLPMLLAAAGIGIGHAVLPDHWMPLAVLARTRGYPTRRVLRLSLAAAVTHVLVSLLAGAVLVVVGMRFRDTVARHADLAVGGVLVATGLVLLVLEVLGRGHTHPHPHPHGHRHDHDHNHDHDQNHDHNQNHDHDGHAHDGPSHRPSHGPGPSHSHRPGQEHPHPQAVAARVLLPGVAVLERPATATVAATPAATPAEPPHRRPRPRHNLLAVLVPFGAAASPDLTILPLFLAAGALGVTPAVGVLAVFAAATIAAIVGLTVATALGTARLTAPWIEKRANALTAATLLVIGGLVVGGVI
ncbi:hypothetical protein [Catenulispora subtropica]|uniref:High-affinity nickel-transporter n=1 Tax=Catenulispora subtropica TaxID=450798 RepID=A0ABP5DX08_9ACTN